MSICKSFLVSGHVQGVWFRASTQMKAESLKVTGYAKNLPDGRVEVLACGKPENIAALQRWLWQGPPNASVDNVIGNDLEAYNLTTFVTM